MTLDTDKKNFLRAIATWIVVIASIRIVSLLNFIPFLYDNMATIIAVFLIYPPVIWSLIDKKRIHYWGLNQQQIKTAFLWFVIISICVFPISFLVNHFYQKIAFNASYHAGTSDIWLFYLFMQLFLISFPEEFFFRGYLQNAFNSILPPKRKILGAYFGWSQIILSGVFALSHSLITLQWWHGFIFFPALLFAWLREKTDTIWASVLFHWACNIFAYWVALHY